MKVSCLQCGKSFKAIPAAKRKFCSRTCASQFKSTKVQSTCERCNKSFSVKLHKVKEGKGRYCSRACSDNIGWKEPCERCGKPVHRTESHANKHPHAYCSRKCANQRPDNVVTRICNECRKSYRTKQSVNKTYCSQSCYDKARGFGYETKPCEYCGIKFTRRKIKLFAKQKYCSNDCQGLARRMPDSARSIYDHQFTETLKNEIRNRDNGICQLCKKPEKKLKRSLDVHHIDYDKTNCHRSNLISLCQSCHSKTNYNREKWKRKFQKMMLT